MTCVTDEIVKSRSEDTVDRSGAESVRSEGIWIRLVERPADELEDEMTAPISLGSEIPVYRLLEVDSTDRGRD